jgi:hypothetical protein
VQYCLRLWLSEVGADAFEREADGRLFVHREVVEYHHVAGSQEV